MTFSVTVLGSSSSLPTSSRYPTAHLLNAYERFFLIDCGEGTQMQLRKFNAKFSKINYLFISHLHGDHYYGVFGLLSTFSLLGRKNDFHIFAHKDLKSIIEFQFKHYPLSYNIVFHDLPVKKTEVIYEDKQITVTTFPLKHSIACNGFLFREKEKERNIKKEFIEYYNLSIRDIVKIKRGEDHINEEGKVIPNSKLTERPYKQRTYAFCTDTAFYPEIIPVIKGVDLLYHESTFANDMRKRAWDTLHSTAVEAAEIAKMAEVKKLLLGHFSSRYTKLDVFKKEALAKFNNVELVKEGKCYHLKQERV